MLEERSSVESAQKRSEDQLLGHFPSIVSARHTRSQLRRLSLSVGYLYIHEAKGEPSLSIKFRIVEISSTPSSLTRALGPDTRKEELTLSLVCQAWPEGKERKEEGKQRKEIRFIYLSSDHTLSRFRAGMEADCDDRRAEWRHLHPDLRLFKPASPFIEQSWMRTYGVTFFPSKDGS